MKFLKYISICLIALVFASCEKKDIEYMTENVTGDQALIQVAYMCPKKAEAANYIYTVVINGQKYSNNGSSFLTTYNYVPSGDVGLFYTVNPGEVTVQFLNSKNEEVYNQKFNVAAGSKQMAVVYDFAKAPVIVPFKEPLTFPGSAETGKNCSVRLYNFIFETDGTPMTDKIQLGLQNTTTKEFTPVGTPVAFGEGSEFMAIDIDKMGPGGSGFNTQGYQRRDICIYRIDAATGENKGTLQYTNSKGAVAGFTDYWNWYIGRGYLEFMRGVLDSKVTPVAMTQFTGR
ncbi:MAG: hypothetical protein Q4B68_04725 [Bacteroidales bacterium]|nr:hypothetical protein [Bacteroidales bacterium]